MSGPKDAIRKRNDGRGPPSTCNLGCKEFRPVGCDVLDPFTVAMHVRCIRCEKPQTRIGDLRGLSDPDNGKTAESFARDFVDGTVYGRARA